MCATRLICAGAMALVCAAAMPAMGAISPAGLIGYYPFDGNGNDLGTNNVSVSIVDTSTAASSFSGTGKFAQAFETASDGGNFPSPGGRSDVARDGADSALPKLVGDDTFTLTGWFKFNAIGGQTETQNHHFIDMDRGGAVAGVRVSMIAGLSTDGGTTFQQQSLSFASNGAGATIDLNTGGNPAWAANQWYFFAGRLDGASNSVLWLVPDGTAWADRMGAGGGGNAPGPTAAALQFGREGGNGAMNGLKDDFSIWNRALTTDEVQQIYEAGMAGIPLGQVAVPEPAGISLAIAGIASLLGLTRRRHRA